MDQTSKAKTKQKKGKVKKENTKSFRAQIVCKCNKNCAARIDVVNQKDIFDQFYGCSSWSKETEFLRSIVNREPVKENLNPQINLKKKDFFSTYNLYNSDGEKQRVCLSFITGLLQVNRTKVFRAVASIKNNPFAVDRRGKSSKKKTAAEATAFAKEFIQSIPSYESKIDPNLSDTKFLHPNLTVNAIYRLYGNMCEFKQKRQMSKSVFMKCFKTNFPHLQAFKVDKSKCLVCQDIDESKKFKVLSPAVLEDIQKQKNDHYMALRQLKNELINNIDEPEIGVEILTFELQRPLQLPLLPIDESYDVRCLWLSNLCVFDELDKKAYMYVWDEITAKRGPEEIASCLLNHISDVIPESTRKVVLYSDSSDLYRNMQITAILGKLFDYTTDELQTIEQRFFFSGHSANDCNRCFDTIEKKIKTSHNLFTPDDWVQLVSSCKQSNNNFNVNKMCSKDFVSTKGLKMVIKEDDINWANVKSIICSRSEPSKIRLKYFNQDIEKIVPLYELNCAQKLTYKHTNELAISKAKHDDIATKTLKCIPPEKREYYQNIQYDAALKDEEFALASHNL